VRWLLGALAVVFVALVAAAAGIGWLVGTEAGLHWAAAQVPELRAEALHGRLAGEIRAEKIVYSGEGMAIHASKVTLRAHLAALFGGRLTIDPLSAAAIEIDLRELRSDAGQATPELPLRLHIANATVDEIEVRRGDARFLVKEVKVEHARLGRELSLAGSLYWPDERFATRARVVLGGTLERIEAHVAADIAGVAAEARGVVVPRSPQRLQAIEARAGPIDLARLEGPRTALSARVRAEMSAGGALAGTLRLENSLPGPVDADRVPFTRLDARFVTDFATARLDGMRAALQGGATVRGEAILEKGHVQAKLVAAEVDLRAIHSRLRRTALAGPLQVIVAGERQWARASLTQEGIGLTAQVLRIGDLLEVQELAALADGGEVSGSGRVTLSGAMPFAANLAIRRFDPSALGDYPAGSLSGAVAAQGRIQPRDLELEWRLGGSVLHGHAFQSEGAARIAGRRVAQADAGLRLGANRLTARGAYGRPGDELAVALDAPRLEEFAPLAGSLRARGTLSGSLDNPRAAISVDARALALPGGVRLQDLSMKLNGTLAAHDAEIAARAPELALDMQARLRGGWSEERGWTGQVRSLTNSGAYRLELAAPAPLRIARERIELGRLEARVADGRLLIREAAWSPARLASSGEFSALPAQWLILALRQEERLSATLLVDGEWELVRTGEIQGHLRVRRADGDLALLGGRDIAPDGRDIALGLERATLEARFSEGRTVAHAEAVSRIAKLAVDGEIMPALALQAKIEFAELGTLTRPFLDQARLAGRLSAELRASGTLARPRVHGTLEGSALAFELPAYGVVLQEGSLVASLEGDRLRIESLAARGGEGRLAASGTLPLGLEGAARIAWRADRLAVLERPDMRLVASGEGEASYDGKRISLTGDLRADRGHFEFTRERLPTLGEDVVILGDSELKRAKGRGESKLPVALDLRLDLGDNLVVRGYGYDGKVAGLVDLATTKDGDLRAFGRLRAVHATFVAYGQRLDVDPGVLIFDGPIDNPTLQITAWRRNQAVEAGVQLTGTARAPSVNLVSQPPVPEGERLSWLVLGRPPSGATQADLGLLQAAAGALLAGGDSVPLDRRIARRFGLDELTLRGSGELTGQVLAVGKRLSERLYISYEQGIGAVASNLVKLDYALGRRWTLRAETGSTSGGGLYYRYSWD
jgi:translocation and assembly module TamB